MVQGFRTYKQKYLRIKYKLFKNWWLMADKLVNISNGKVNVQKEIQMLKNEADLLSHLEEIKTINEDIKILESELDKDEHFWR